LLKIALFFAPAANLSANEKAGAYIPAFIHQQALFGFH
jgi:hypothetical protein